MAAERQFHSFSSGKVVIICAVSILLCCSHLFAEQRAKQVRHSVFSLKRISAEQGKKYLAQTKTGTVSQLPGANALLVTGSSRELIKAKAILKIVDSNEPFVIRAISPASDADNLPSNERIEAKVDNISIGTFSNPPYLPGGPSETRAIIDIHDDDVIAIAPVSRIEEIITAIEQLQKTTDNTEDAADSKEMADSNSGIEQIEEPNAGAAADQLSAENADTNETEMDGIFSKLLKSLDEAEKVLSTQSQQLHRPNEPNLPGEFIIRKEQITAVNEPNIITIAPEPNEPNIIAIPPEPNLPAGVEDLQVEDTAKEPEPGLKQPETKITKSDKIVKPDGIEKVDKADEPAAVRPPYSPEPVPLGEETLELNLPEKLKIIDLLDLVGKYLNLDYMYDPVKVTGEVTLKVQGPIKVKDLYPRAESVLKFKGFVMTRKGNLVTIVPKAEALDVDAPLISDVNDKIHYGNVIITRIFKLKHIAPESAKNLLTAMKLGEDINTSISETGTLIVTGYAYRMSRIEQLLDMIDLPGKPKEFRFRQLKFTMANTLKDKVKTLAEQLGTVSIDIAAPQAPPPKPTRGRPKKPAPARPPAKTVKPTVYLDADERTNRILMIGLKEQLDVVESLIDTLDVEKQDLRTLRLYDIQNVGAEEVLEKLGELGIISGGRATAAAKPRSAKGRPSKPAAPIAAQEALVDEPQVVIIEATNSLLVNATAEQHAQIATIISYVDSETEEAAINYKVYPLENQEPEDLAGILNKFV